MAFSKLTTEPITAKLQVRYGENIADLLGISRKNLWEKMKSYAINV